MYFIEKNFFDQQQQQAEGANEEQEEEVVIPSVPADSETTDERCEVCGDKFDQFFNEETEEWHLNNAVRIEEKTYHPVCYEDYQVSHSYFVISFLPVTHTCHSKRHCVNKIET